MPSVLRRIGRRAAAVARDDSGSSAVEIVIVFPAALLVLFVAIQAASYSYARSIALNAAQEAATAQRAYDAAPGAGQARAASFLNRAGGGLKDQHVSVTSSRTEVTVVVTGRCLSIVPGMDFHVHQTAHGTVERFTS